MRAENTSAKRVLPLLDPPPPASTWPLSTGDDANVLTAAEPDVTEYMFCCVVVDDRVPREAGPSVLDDGCCFKDSWRP